MKKIIQFGTVLLLLTMMACQTGLSEKQEKRIDELSSRADSSMVLLNQIDTAKGLASANHFFENIRFIQNEMKDTLDPKTALYIDRYYGMRKAFKLFGQNYPRVIAEVKTTKKQIEDLKHDAEAGLLTEQEIQQYLDLESNNLALAEEGANDIWYAISTVQPIYDTMNPKIDSLIAASKIKFAESE